MIHMTTNDLYDRDEAFHVDASQVHHISHPSRRVTSVHYLNGSVVEVDNLVARVVVS